MSEEYRRHSELKKEISNLQEALTMLLNSLTQTLGKKRSKDIYFKMMEPADTQGEG